METPKPVNLNALKNILAKSKAVMNAVEEKNPTKPSSSRNVNESYNQPTYNQPVYDESDEKELNYGTPDLSAYQSSQPKMYTTEQVMASNLPPAIKEAMIKNPIPQLQMPPSSFSLEDLGDLVEQPKKPVQLNERKIQQNSDMITISRTELKELINESLLSFFKNTYEKTLTEAAIKKTINTLINEGKINVKKKS
jgi:hypothetical protein